MKKEYNRLISLFGSLDKSEQYAVLQDLIKIADDVELKKRKEYLSIMETMVGYSITQQDHSREKAYARAVVAYVMISDGYSESSIAKELHRDHSTIHHYKNLMNDARKFPNAYYDLIEMYNQYKKLLK